MTTPRPDLLSDIARARDQWRQRYYEVQRERNTLEARLSQAATILQEHRANAKQGILQVARPADLQLVVVWLDAVLDDFAAAGLLPTPQPDIVTECGRVGCQLCYPHAVSRREDTTP